MLQMFTGVFAINPPRTSHALCSPLLTLIVDNSSSTV